MESSKLIENNATRQGRNTGFKKILRAIKQNGSPLPIFETDEAHDYFVTRFFVREGFYDSDEGEEGGSATLKLPPNNVEDKIITMVRENPNITRKEIANRLNMTVDGVKYHIKKMTASGKIKYVGSSRNGHWETM